MFVLDTVKEDPKQKLLIAGSNAEEKSNCAVEVENCKGSSPKKIIEKFLNTMTTASEPKIPSDLEKTDGLVNNVGASPSYKPRRSPAQENKVELRMDEITSKFKNAFERMAELESLQLSIEQDADEEMKSKWLRNRDRCFELNLIRKKELVKDKEVVARASASPRAVENSVSVTPKEERLSPITPTTPVKGGSLEIDKDLEKQTDNRVEGAVEDSVFPQEWSYEEQFKKLYELGEEPDRKEFLDKLFAFMQHRGTPVNRVPIMAKQTLDLFRLFKLVVERGGLVEVINKKIWRGIIKGLNLPSSVTSAAFTLRTQYMKYLYPYECSTLKLSSPSELQCAIDGNRRDTTRRPSIGHYTSMVEPEVGFYSNSTSPKSNCSSPTLKRASSPTVTQSVGHRFSGQNEFVSPSFHGNNGIGFTPAIHRLMASSSSDSRTFTPSSRSKSPSCTTEDKFAYEPPYKKSASSEDFEKQITFSQCPWANIKIRTPGRDISSILENEDKMPQNREENPCISAGKSPKQPPSASFDQINGNSLLVSIELNGIRYQGVLYAQQR